ncbi:MAG: hypothetical protein HY270_13615 [Deltaproteobacteria bacterium]|nr:hypothetical protein [Deltaproteobacteria bacterium]
MDYQDQTTPPETFRDSGRGTATGIASWQSWQKTLEDPGGLASLIALLIVIMAPLFSARMRRFFRLLCVRVWLRIEKIHRLHPLWFPSFALVAAAVPLWLIFAVIYPWVGPINSWYLGVALGSGVFVALLSMTLLLQYLHFRQPSRDYITSMIKAAIDLQRKSRYADTLPKLHSVVDYLRNTRGSLVRSAPLDEHLVRFRHDLQQVLSFVTAAFDLSTGKDCRASIKMLMREQENREDPRSFEEFSRRCLVQTLTRDPASRQGTRASAPLMSYRHLMPLFTERNNSFYLSNDVISSWKENEFTHPSLGRFDPNLGKWPLPYSSLFVWPIRRRLDRTSVEDVSFDVVGFLCVDAPARNAFDRWNDFHMGSIVADSLFYYMKDYLVPEEQL